MPDSLILVSEIVILPSFSFPIWSSSSNAALSKRGGAPRAKFIWSTTSTPPRAPRAASSNLPLLAGNGALPPRVTLTTSRSADQTHGLASGTSRVSSLTSRTPGTASTEATALRRPSSEKASAANVTSRPATAILLLSSTVSLSADVERAARSGSRRAVVGPAAIAHKTTNGITPGHHLLLHLKSPCIRYPAGLETERKQTLARLSNPKEHGNRPVSGQPSD